MQFSKRPASATEISCAKEQQSCCLLHADWIHSLPSSNQRGVTVWLQMSFQNVTTDFRGKKIKNPALVIFFSLEMHAARNMYKFIFVWIVDEMTFTDRYFFLQGHQESLMTKSRRTRAFGFGKKIYPCILTNVLKSISERFGPNFWANKHFA